MRIKDIKVGEVYAVGSDNYPHQGTVVEVGEMDRTVYGSGWYASKVRGKFVKVSYPDRGVGLSRNDEVVTPQQVRRTWADHEVLTAERREAHQRTAEASSQRWQLAKELAEAVQSAIGAAEWSGISGSTTNGCQINLSMYSVHAQALIALLEKGN